LDALQFWLIATLMVIATTATLVVPMFWWTREADAVRMPARQRRVFALLVAIVVPLAALGFYAFSGRPDLASQRPSDVAVTDAATLHARAAMRGGGDGGDLDAAIERLRARLAKNPDDAEGWALLAQSYEFEGRSAEAAEARRHAGVMGEAAATPVPAAPAPALDADATRLATQAEEHRRKREFAQAVKTFAELERRGSLTADLWADYADALGGARGKLDDDAARRIDQALRLEPDHAKALWLRASWQMERRDFAGALDTWQHLARVLPPDSPDARIIAANLEEAREKLGAGGPRESRPLTPVTLRGSVSLDPRLRDRVRSGDTLFVFARAADERGPPLAVLRTAAGPWPLSFELDDRNSMLPGRSLSGFNRVILEARISRSGNALPQPGDLRAVSAVLDPRTSPAQRLTIAEEVSAPPAGGG
jgi:cytochrome c-type biogenesis protein CcmH